MEFSNSLDGFTLFVGTNDFGGTITKGKMPFPKRVLKDRKPGGTNMKIKTQHGWDLDDYELTVAGISSPLFSIMNGRRVDQQQLLLRNSFTDEFSGAVKAMDIELWGRTEETDFLGELQSEEDSEGSITFVPVIANCTFAGKNVFKYNAKTGQVVIGEDDETEAIRIALGRS